MRVSLTTIFSSLLCTVLVSSQDLDTFDKKCVENYGVPSADPVPGSFSNDDCTDVDGTRGAIQTAVDKLGDMNIYAVTKQVGNGINYVIFVTRNERTYRVPVYQDLTGTYSLQEEEICYSGAISSTLRPPTNLSYGQETFGLPLQGCVTNEALFWLPW
ncbi:hypothetical protein AO1008_00254 [Aspergillus oryzae 100-8]|uniref:Uncharacterized protein n=1 Tax=Aspergillus oryzae (strain 3.042) TaxID=1160506 RepID=I8A4N8_ASPO3|nr:hypothetical protein Ao3042_04107 [Aspergillus oryzae 3.042]KDE84957.1 hypothetical protein AO1008_00254 [Aspergillus oryzae 100-8]|eukprot:EIT79514.1 hypothetical protein Ao3042_04107 [Aspergillus oryzae 3.042]